MNILNFPLGAFHVLCLKGFWEGAVDFWHSRHGSQNAYEHAEEYYFKFWYKFICLLIVNCFILFLFLIFGVIWHGSQIPVAAVRPRAHILKNFLSA